MNPTGGGIALFTTTRLAFSSSNAALSYAFYERLFLLDSDGKICTIGQTAAKAKNSLSVINSFFGTLKKALLSNENKLKEKEKDELDKLYALKFSEGSGELFDNKKKQKK